MFTAVYGLTLYIYVLVSWHFLLFLNIEMMQMIEIFPHGRHGAVYSSYSIRCCWYAGSLCGHCISGHGIDTVFQEYSNLSIRRFNICQSCNACIFQRMNSSLAWNNLAERAQYSIPASALASRVARSSAFMILDIHGFAVLDGGLNCHFYFAEWYAMEIHIWYRWINASKKM